MVATAVTSPPNNHAAAPSPTASTSARRAPARRTAARQTSAGLAASTAFVVALGAGLPPEPVPDVRGANLAGDDPVRGEWDIAVVGPHFAAALVARDLNDNGQDMERTFDYVLTYDREVVLEIATSPTARTLPVTGTPALPEAGAAVPAQGSAPERSPAL